MEIPHQQTNLAPVTSIPEPKKPWINKDLALGILFLAGLFIALVCLIYLWRFGA